MRRRHATSPGFSMFLVEPSSAQSKVAVVVMGVMPRGPDVPGTRASRPSPIFSRVESSGRSRRNAACNNFRIKQ